nr:hypothetical protein [Candidatus Sigynarchaeota archaeon]
WHDVVELTTMSEPFMQEIVDNLGKERRAIPVCEVVDDDKSVHVDFNFVVEQQNFFQERASILELLQHHDKLGQQKNVPLAKILDYLEHDNDYDRMKAFIHVLHLIQDGDLILNDDKDAATNPKIRLWRRPA